MRGVFRQDTLRNAPTLLPAAPGELVKPTLLGTPEVRTLLGYTRRVLHLSGGNTLAVFSFGSAPTSNAMFLIGSGDLSVKRVAIPNNDFASHGAALGKDGLIYILPYGASRAYAYSISEDRFQPISIDLPPKEYTWEAFGASNGRTYFGTYPNAIFGEYNPATKQCTLWKQVAPNAKYVTDFREDAGGAIRFRAWGPEETWITFRPDTGELKRASGPEKTPPGSSKYPSIPLSDTGFSTITTVMGRRFVLSFPSGRFWEVLPNGELIRRGDSGSPAEPWYLEAVSDAVIGISHFGAVFRYDLRSGKMKRVQLPNRVPGGNTVMFLEAISPRCVIGANYSQQNLFQIDPQTGKIKTSERMIARVTGEVMCAVGLRGKAYLGIYVHALLSEYDPATPFEYGANPRELTALYSPYAQTRPAAAVTDGKRVYIATESDYGKLGGALAVIEPESGKVEVYPQLIRDQDLSSLAYDPKSGLLWGGTNRWGQMRAHPPTQPDSVLYAFDPAMRKVVATLNPWPGTDVTTTLGVSGDGILIATNGEDVALIATGTHEILFKGKLPSGIPGKVRSGSDGFGYMLANGNLYRWDFTRNTITPVAVAPGCTHLTEYAPGEWALADTASVYRLRLSKSSGRRL